jgi:hypothetical protein
MTPADMIEQAALDGVTVTVTPTGGLKANGAQQAVDRWAPILRDSKAALLAELQLEKRRAGVLAMLQANPDIRYAIEINEPDIDPVMVSLAIRDAATCEVKIPQARFEPFSLLALIEKHTVSNPNNPNNKKMKS